jgi:hypothetical protein
MNMEEEYANSCQAILARSTALRAAWRLSSASPENSNSNAEHAATFTSPNYRQQSWKTTGMKHNVHYHSLFL